MSGVPVLDATQHWECPSCDFVDVTRTPGFISHMHGPCPGARGLWVGMVPAGTRAVHVVHELEDYAGDKLIRCDANDRPVTHVNTVRDDGMDAVAYPITAVATREEMENARHG